MTITVLVVVVVVLLTPAGRFGMRDTAGATLILLVVIVEAAGPALIKFTGMMSCWSAPISGPAPASGP